MDKLSYEIEAAMIVALAPSREVAELALQKLAAGKAGTAAGLVSHFMQLPKPSGVGNAINAARKGNFWQAVNTDLTHGTVAGQNVAGDALELANKRKGRAFASTLSRPPARPLSPPPPPQTSNYAWGK